LRYSPKRDPVTRIRRAIGRFFIYLLICAGAGFVMIPFLWMVSTSLKEVKDVFVMPPDLIPNPPIWRNYVDAWTTMPFTLYLRNTLFVTLTATIGHVLAASLVAFGFARLSAPGRNLLFAMVLASMMLPRQVTLIPTYMLFRRLRWINTFNPLIVPPFLGGGAFYIFLLRQYMMGIPRELDDAAKLDGCSNFGIYWRLVLPLSRPALAAVAIFSFRAHWQDFLGPLIYLSGDNITLALAIRYLLMTRSEGMTMWNHIMAVSAIMVTPMVLVYFFAQKYFIQGVVVSGIKG
jgi:ABC-type glycerol-3-phosphate transport system permease component